MYIYIYVYTHTYIWPQYNYVSIIKSHQVILTSILSHILAKNKYN